MAGLVFHFEPNDRDVFSGRAQDIDAWIYAAKMSGDITKMIMVNSAGPKPTGLDMHFEWSIVSEIPPLVGNVTYMVMPSEQSLPLWGYDHETDWYVFGPASGWHIGGHDQVGVYVPQANPNIALHAVHIAPIVMAHRYKVLHI